MWHKRARNRGVANIQISSKLFCAFTPFSKKQSKYSGSPEIVKFPINAHPGKDDLTWRELQHLCTTCLYFFTLLYTAKMSRGSVGNWEFKSQSWEIVQFSINDRRDDLALLKATGVGCSGNEVTDWLLIINTTAPQRAACTALCNPLSYVNISDTVTDQLLIITTTVSC